ncbi:MFS transporter [Paracoccus aminophilus]|nr:MFS transporter [Paracoccus aminophilus]
MTSASGPLGDARPPATRPLTPARALAALAITQNIGYGTIFYSYATLNRAMTAEFGFETSAGFLVISVAMLLSGLCGAGFGRLLDRGDPARYMLWGSLVTGLLYVLLAAAPSYWVVAVAIVALQISGIAVLYSTSFPLLSRFPEAEARRAITRLSLIAGFASTLFWPLVIWGTETLGWRGLTAVYAGLHLGVALPLHLWMARQSLPAPRLAPVSASPETDRALRQRRFWPLAISFAATGFIGTVLMVHLVPLLEGLRMGAALYLATTAVGPAMVLARIVSAVFWPEVHPLKPAFVAALLFPFGIVLLLILPQPVAAGIGLCIAYGIAHGLFVIIGGTLPLAVFGPIGYGEILGRINRVRMVTGAFAPALFAYAQSGLGPNAALVLLVGIGGVGILCLIDLARQIQPGREGNPPSGALA